MVIESGNINNILRTYNKQIKYGKISSVVDSPASSRDKVTFSPEARKMMFISSIVSESEKDVDIEDLKKRLESFDFSKMSEEEIGQLKNNILKSL